VLLPPLDSSSSSHWRPWWWWWWTSCGDVVDVESPRLKSDGPLSVSVLPVVCGEPQAMGEAAGDSAGLDLVDRLDGQRAFRANLVRNPPPLFLRDPAAAAGTETDVTAVLLLLLKLEWLLVEWLVAMLSPSSAPPAASWWSASCCWSTSRWIRPRS
jgi:hypothetical protein